MPFKQRYTDEEIVELLNRNYQKFEDLRNDFFIYRCRICDKKGEKHRSHIISYTHSASPFCKCLRQMGFIPLFISEDNRLIRIKCIICKLEKMHRFTDGLEKLICATPGCTEERNVNLTKQRMYKELRNKRWEQFDNWLKSVNAPKDSNKSYARNQMRKRLIQKSKLKHKQIPLDDDREVLKHFEHKCFFCGHAIKKVDKKTFIQLGSEIVPECGFCRKQRKEAEKEEKRGKKDE